MGWYVPKANVDHTISGQGIVINTLAVRPLGHHIIFNYIFHTFSIMLFPFEINGWCLTLYHYPVWHSQSLIFVIFTLIPFPHNHTLLSYQRLHDQITMTSREHHCMVM